MALAYKINSFKFFLILLVCFLLTMLLKTPARQVLQKAANDRLKKRRTAVGKINELLHKMSLETLQLKPKDIDKPLLARALRLLARRCVERDQKTELRAATNPHRQTSALRAD